MKEKLYTVTNLISEVFDASANKTTTEVDKDISVKVWALSEEEARAKAAAYLNKRGAWLPCPATVASPFDLGFADRMADGLKILATR